MRWIAAFLLLGCCLPAHAQQAQINNVRLWTAPDHTRLVFDTTGPVAHKVFSLKSPERLVIDIQDARLRSKFPDPGQGNPLVRGIRGARRDGNDLRVVVDLKRRTRPKSFMLKPNRRYGHRLVIDLEPQRSTVAVALSGKSEVVARRLGARNLAQGREVVIAIDAGHGGDDPGAQGAGGTREKDVVLAIARRLARLVKQERGMRPVMIRDGDYYIGLRKRIDKARRYKADLFVSIHADSFRDARARGASVYTLSHRGASSEAARWLAERENSADLIGGIELDEQEHLLASVLLDLSQSATIQASRQAAEAVLKKLKALGRTHKNRVQKAGFVVLKSPDIPSLLVETAYISNPAEERKLKDGRFQARLARALMQGIRAYFHAYPPPGTLLAHEVPRKHVISRGDTLSEIASQYRVSLRALRSTNRLDGDRIRIGQVLTIPDS